MKKIIASIAAMLVTVSMVACGDIEDVERHENDVTTVTTTVTTTSISTTGTTTTNNTTTSAKTDVIITKISTDICDEIVISTNKNEEIADETSFSQTEPVTEQTQPETVATTKEKSNHDKEIESNPQPGEVHQTEEPPHEHIVEEFLVYKPSTHYAHRSTCRWAKDDAYRCDDFSNIEIKICSECKPEISEYIPYVPQANKIDYNLSDYEYNLLCQLIANEAGFGSLVERAKIVGAVMNGCKRWNKSVTTFIYSACVPYGFKPGKEYYYDVVRASDMGDAIEYYFTYGESGFYDSGYWVNGADSWSGGFSDGLNRFYRA